MTRAAGNQRKEARKRIIKESKGFRGSKHRLHKTAKEQVSRSKRSSFEGRKQRKRDKRSLWIVRLNNACSEKGISYSRFIRMCTLAQVKINRKLLSEMAINNPSNFEKLLEKVQNPW